MTELLTRSVIDNRIQRATGQLDTTLGAGTRAAFEAPTLGGLAATQFSIPSRLDDFTDEQQMARRTDEAARWRENDGLQSELLSVSDPARKDDIIARIQEIQTESDVQLDALTRESVDAGRIESQEALNEEFGDIGLTFDRATSREEAEILAQGRREEIIRGAIIEAGPKGVLPGAARFGAGLAAMAVDPVEVATMFIPVVGPAGRAASVARFGRVGGRALVGATEGLIGNALTEPLYFGLSRSQQLDYTMSDALTNIALGAVLGGVLGVGSGIVSKSTAANIAVKEDAALDLFDAAINYASVNRSKVVSGEVALRQFATGQAVSVAKLFQSIAAREQIEVLHKSLSQMRKTPLISFIRDFHKVDPKGKFATELRHGDITPKTAPGLFSNRGIGDLDTIVASEAENILPGISRAAGVDRNFLSRDGLIDALRAERAGEDPIGQRSLVEGEIEELTAYQARIDRISEQAEDLGFVFGTADDIRLVDSVIERGGDFEAAMDVLARSNVDDMNADLARDAQNIELDPQADFKASARADVVLPDTFAEETVAEMEALVKQLDEAGELSKEARAELAEIKDITARATAYNEVTAAAATCLLRA